MSDTLKFGRTGDCDKITNLLKTDNTEDESDELFSDDEQKKELKDRADVSQDASVLNRSETPLSLLSSSNRLTTDAIVPSTPLSLLPFLSKINEQWSSDLETPQAQPCVKPTSKTTKAEKTPEHEQHSPDVSTVKSSDKMISDSPIIVSKRRLPKRRRIFRSSISIDPLAVTNNEDITINVETSPSKDNSVTQDNTINIARSIPCINNVLEDSKLSIPNKIQDTCNNEELETLKNTASDSSNTWTQEFFKNASFSNIDDLCSSNFDKQATVKAASQCNQSIENINEESNIEEDKNINFSTARGTSINISKQALFKAKRLFADTFYTDETQIQNYESLTKKNSNEQENKHLPSSSVINNTTSNISINTVEKVLFKPKSQFTEQLKNYDKMHITDYKKSFITKSPVKLVNTTSVLSSTVSGAPTNISKETLSKVKTLLMDESDKNNDDNVLIEYCERSSVDKNPIKQNNMTAFTTAGGKAISISEKSLTKAKTLFAEQLDTIVEPDTSSRIDASDNNQCDMKTSDICFRTARGISIDISEEALSKSKAMFAEKMDVALESIVAEETHNDGNEIKNQEENVSKIEFQLDSTSSNTGFRTARGTSIDISKEALSKAKAMFAEKMEISLESVVAEEIHNDDNEIKNQEENVSKIEFQLDSTSSNTGFRTARGATIDISEKALSKAKAMFAEKVDVPLELVVTEETHNDDKEIKNLEENVSKMEFQLDSTSSNTGFRTARGTSIDISKEALSKAKAMFAEKMDVVLESIVAEETHNDGNEIKNQEENISKIEFQLDSTSLNIGFRTARGTTIGISEKALSKAKAMFAEQVDVPLESIVAEKTYSNDNEIKNQEDNVSKITFQLDCTSSNIDFRTARGTTIDISEKALSKAKVMFAEQVDVQLESVAKEIHNDNNEIKNIEEDVSKIEFQSSNFGFRTARGTNIDISEEALFKAKTMFAEQMDVALESVGAKETHNESNEAKREKVKTSNIGFSTARDVSINISEQALSKTKTLFADQLDHPLKMDISENIDDNNEEIKSDLKISYGEIQAASDPGVTISNNALLKESLVSNNYPDGSSSDLTNALLQKRKFSETNSDESTPLGVRHYVSQTKKARLSNELQARKLLFDNSDVDMDNDENRNPDEKEQTNVIASSDLGSPTRDTVELPESSTEGSPIIGGQSISRKRKSFGYRREKSGVWTKIIKANNEDVAPKENVQEIASAKKNDEKESDVRTSQIEKQTAENNTESSEYSDNQMMMDFIDESTKVLQDRLMVALEQEKIITAKRKNGSKQLMGHLYLYKQMNSKARLSLRKISNGAPPASRSYQELIDRRIPPNILSITAATAASYKFRCSDFYGSDVARSNIHGIEMEDGVRLIMDENGYVGIWEFLRAFLASPGVDPNLVPARWIENHYRWIVWKLASMDRMKFGSSELPRALTPARVMAQLKYRYDREIDRSQRPALRRILEKDDVASKRMILCVSSIVENGNVSMEIGKSPRVGVPRWKIELTDGWYSIAVCIDTGMTNSVSIGKVREGTKLVVSGAELLNCDQGYYPLEAPADVCLKLHTNSTRRARWDAKLGYAARSGPIPIRLHNVCPSGGLIGKMTIIVARVYPMLYHERTASGDSIMRNAKCEEKAQRQYEQQCWSDMETFYAKAERDFHGKDFSREAEAFLGEDYEASSTEKQHDELLQELRQKEERLKQKLQSKLRESLPGPRQVSPLLRVRVCDGNVNAILSIWSPSEEVVDAVKEGGCVSLCNVAASGKRGSELQLTAGRCAIFKPGKMHDTSYPVRVCTSFCEIANSEFAPAYGEFDTVGFICSVGPAPYGMKDFEVVHLAHLKESSGESSYLSILFWQGIASYGYAEILIVGSTVACSNLEWRRANSWNVPVAYCTDRSTFTRNPRRNHLYESFESLRALITDPVKYAEECTSKLNELQKKPTPTRYTPNKNTPIKIYNTASSVDKKLVDYASPLSTPKLGAGSSSNYIATRPSIQRRLEKLECYDQPPELSPIILRQSKRVSLPFRSPISISDANSASASNTNRSRDSNSFNSPKKQ